MNSLEVRPIFPSNLYSKMIDINKIRSLTEKIREYSLTKPNIVMSNIGGFQARFEVDEKNEHLEEMKKILFEELFQLPKFKIETWWLNINYKNSFNASHTHPECDYAGIIYLKVPNKSGAIRFQNPNAFGRSVYFHKISEADRMNTYQYIQYQVEPKEGLIILFPSDLQHYVMPNESDEERISLAFNIKFE